MLEAASYDGRRAPVTSCPLSLYVSPQNPPPHSLPCLPLTPVLSVRSAGRQASPATVFPAAGCSGRRREID